MQNLIFTFYIDPAHHFGLDVSYENGRSVPNLEYLNMVKAGIKVVYFVDALMISKRSGRLRYIVVTVPTAALGNTNVTATVGGVSSHAVVFIALPIPSITNLNPTSQQRVECAENCCHAKKKQRPVGRQCRCG